MAAGNSSRCGFDKLLAGLNQQSVLEASLSTFEASDFIDEIWVVGKSVAPTGKIKGSIEGGASRFQSVSQGIKHCAKHYDENVRIVVHNAANPFLSLSDLEAGLKMAKKKGNLIFGFFSPNSIKQVSDKGIVNNFLDREQIFETQTPQISTLSTFKKALDIFGDRSLSSAQTKETETGLSFSTEPRDEAELLALSGEVIHVYACDPSNTKITFASDFTIPLGLKIGLGEDSHRFAEAFEAQKPFRLGGIDLSEGELSSDGNSDGDVIIHALCNALLSAAGEKTFDPIAAPICAAGETKSVAYLKATISYLENLGRPLKLDQVLISLEGAQPKIAPQHEAIVESLANLLSINPNQIGLTYTTGEGLNDYGQGLGMRAFVVVTIAAWLPNFRPPK